MFRHSRRLAACVVALTLPLGVGSAAAPSAAVPQAGPSSVHADTNASEWADAKRVAEAALHRAQEALRPTSPPAVEGGAHDAHDAHAAHAAHAAGERRDLTLTLRDLRAGLPYLDTDQRRAARSVLARPTQGADDPNGDGYKPTTKKNKSCSAHVCVWWVETSTDKVPAADVDGNARPDQVDTTLEVLSSVWNRVVTVGRYRAPLPDRGRGGDDRLDVFLADLGDEGLYGYCAPESPGPGRSASGYCVLDNDYAEFADGDRTPLDYLQVTAAHEFFHAVQFAYDVMEDDWFMEGTAMWMEDELYTDVNDNVRYLQGSQLTSPTRPLDRPAPGLGGPYVSWVFWRYLTETFPDRGGSGLPLVMREVWRRAQAYTADRPRTYSMDALALSVAARGTPFSTLFARFGEANRHPQDAYDEGLEQGYPTAPAVAAYDLSTEQRQVPEKVATLAHMTNYTVVFRPGGGFEGAGWRIRVPVNMPNRARGSRAQLTVVRDSGARERSWVALDKNGNGVATAPFRTGDVVRVELTLTNSGRRYRCYRGTALSCQGISLDDGLKSYFKASTYVG